MTTTVDIPDSEYYLAGYIDEALRFQPLNQRREDDPTPVNRNELCALKIENRSGQELWIELKAYVQGGEDPDACAAASIPSTHGHLDANGDWDPNPPPTGSETESFWTGQWVFLSYRARCVEVKAWRMDGEYTCRATADCAHTINIADKSNLAHIGPGRSYPANPADIVFTGRGGRLVVYSMNGQIEVRNLVEESFTLKFSPSGNEKKIENNESGARAACDINDDTCFTLTGETSGCAATYAILRPDLHRTDIVGGGTTALTSKPYAVIPDAEGAVTVHNKSNETVSVWKMQDKDNTKKELDPMVMQDGAWTCPEDKTCSHRFIFDDGNKPHSLHWHAGRDPKVLIKQTQCPPPPTESP